MAGSFIYLHKALLEKEVYMEFKKEVLPYYLEYLL